MGVSPAEDVQEFEECDKILVEGRQHLPGCAALREVRGVEEVRVVCIREEKEASSGEFWEKPVEERAEFDGDELVRAMKRPRCKREEKEKEKEKEKEGEMDCFAPRGRRIYTGGWIEYEE